MSVNEGKLCQGKDIFERMNYLYQASRFVAKKSDVAAAHYGNIMMSCAKKAVLRMEPDIKRTICKSCQSPLIPGETARVRLKSKPVKVVQWTCLACKNTRKIPSKKSYKLWIDSPDSLVQIYDYTPKNVNSVSSELTDTPSVPSNIPSTEPVKKGNKLDETIDSREKLQKCCVAKEANDT